MSGLEVIGLLAALEQGADLQLARVPVAVVGHMPVTEVACRANEPLWGQTLGLVLSHERVATHARDIDAVLYELGQIGEDLVPLILPSLGLLREAADLDLDASSPVGLRGPVWVFQRAARAVQGHALDDDRVLRTVSHADDEVRGSALVRDGAEHGIDRIPLGLGRVPQHLPTAAADKISGIFELTVVDVKVVVMALGEP